MSQHDDTGQPHFPVGQDTLVQLGDRPVCRQCTSTWLVVSQSAEGTLAADHRMDIAGPTRHPTSEWVVQHNCSASWAPQSRFSCANRRISRQEESNGKPMLNASSE